VIAQTLAVVIVGLAVLGPGSYLLHVAWRRGGVPRKVAAAVLLAILALVAWLFVPLGAETSLEERISRFVGAWGILFMVVGLGVIAAAALGRFRPDDPPERGPKRGPGSEP